MSTRRDRVTMISRVHPRGRRVGGLLRYLYGPGRREEHKNPRLVAAWAGAGALGDLEPKLDVHGRRDFRHLVAMLEEPIRAATRPPRKPVWHTSMRLAPEDRSRQFSDASWGHMAGEMLASLGVATGADDPGVRWVVVRHGDDHVHIVATLVREDGRTEWLRKDYPRAVAATHDVARRYGLRRQVPPADRTAPRRPSRQEVGKAQRKGWRETPRVQLRRRVRNAAAGAGNEEEFFARLREAGVLVRLRMSTTTDGQVTGYAVALPDAQTAAGLPVYFGGGRLAADLTLPKLRRRWGTAAPTLPPAPMTTAERVDTLRNAASAANVAADEIGRSIHGDPGAAHAAALGAADLLTSAAYAIEGERRGPLHRAAEFFDRAARDAYGRVARSTSRSYELRAMSRLVALMGRISGKDEAITALTLIMNLARLADALEHLREVQQRLHQAEAARSAAAALRAAADGRQHLVAPTLTATTTRVPTLEGGRRPQNRSR